jgi:hypothetical protein
MISIVIGKDFQPYFGLIRRGTGEISKSLERIAHVYGLNLTRNLGTACFKKNHGVSQRNTEFFVINLALLRVTPRPPR